MKFYFFLSCLFISSGIFAQNRDTIFLVRRIADTPYTFYHAVFMDTSMKFKSELTDFSFNKYDSLAYLQTI
ncbi:MAG: hypothetical protein IM600_16515 [Bacteroidetes bacterium]|nr:hypothetical protein [Bacteroidota bacterium]